jgi:hypothetical protein
VRVRVCVVIGESYNSCCVLGVLNGGEIYDHYIIKLFRPKFYYHSETMESKNLKKKTSYAFKIKFV